jgi:predicted DNA-binding protein
MTTTLRRAEPASVRISKDINQALTHAAKEFKTTRAAIVKNALLDYLEDMADLKAIEAAKNKGGRMIPFDELRAELGL